MELATKQKQNRLCYNFIHTITFACTHIYSHTIYYDLVTRTHARTHTHRMETKQLQKHFIYSVTFERTHAHTHTGNVKQDKYGSISFAFLHC